MKQIVRSIITKLLLYAFGPGKGRPGLKIMQFSDESYVLSLVDENFKSVVSINLGSCPISLKVSSDVHLIIEGSVMTEVKGSSWDHTDGVRATTSSMLSIQDGHWACTAIKDTRDLDKRLRLRGKDISEATERLRDNLQSEQCHPDHARNL